VEVTPKQTGEVFDDIVKESTTNEKNDTTGSKKSTKKKDILTGKSNVNALWSLTLRCIIQKSYIILPK
jgi:hypothetical protein